jgi:sec-independent protein translocase protein TatC
MTDESSQPPPEDSGPPEDPHILPPERQREDQLSEKPETTPEQIPEEDAGQMPFLGHLEELRWRLLKALAAILVGAVVCFAFSDELLQVLTLPYEDAVRSMETSGSSSFVQAVQKLLGEWTGQVEEVTPDREGPLPERRRLQALKVMTTFFIQLQIALIGGLILALPVVFYQLWQFVAPGLMSREKRLTLPIVALSVVCFSVGALIAYWIVLPMGLRFFLAIEPPNITSQWAIGEYISFVLRLILGFGAVFEMPVLTLFLSRIGLLTPAYMRRIRRYAIIGIFVLAAIFTPPDPISQIMMALPLLILYEVSIWVCKISSSKDRDDEKKTD